MRRESDLALVAARMTGGEPLVDGLAAAAGVHLRWAFRQILGFPRNGFTVWALGHRGRAPERVAELGLPPVADEFMRRVAGPYPASEPALRRRFATTAEELTDLAATGEDDRRLASDGDPVRLRALDMVLLAALDPHVARGLGLSIITAPTFGNDTRFWVTGHWGDALYPPQRADLRELVDGTDPECRLEPGVRTLALDEDDEGALLRCHGAPDTALRLVFAVPVMVAELHVESPSAVEWTVRVDGRAGPPPRRRGRWLEFRADGTRSFQRLELASPRSETWIVRGIAHRARDSAIGDIASPRQTPALEPPLAPGIVALRHSSVPARLDPRTGTVRTGGRVETAAHSSLDPRRAAHPVRLHVGRSPSPGPPATVLTDAAPALFRRDALVASWRLDGDARERRTRQAAARSGRVTYEQALRLRGNGFLSVRERPDLQALDAPFTLRLRARPEPGLAAATLIGNRSGRGFSFGLDGYRARLWLDERSFDAPASIAPGAWVALQAVYDSAQVTLYVGDALAARHDFTGGVGSNPLGVLCLGADAGSVASDVRAGYRGLLCDVSVWRDALTPEEACRELARPATAYHHIDSDVPDGAHHYAVQGVDVLGRTSAWSPSRSVTVTDRSPPEAPAAPSARFVPLSGRVAAGGGTEPDRVLRVRLEPGEPVPGDSLAALAACDANVVRPAPRRGARALAQRFEIVAATDHEAAIELLLRAPPLPALTPRAGDQAAVERDDRIEMSWAWTGRQRLLNPGVREFRVYLHDGVPNTITGRVTEVGSAAARDEFIVRTDVAAPGGALEGCACQIGDGRYRIVDRPAVSPLALRVAYGARPILRPAPGMRIRLSVPPSAARDFSATWDAGPTWQRRAQIEPLTAAAAVALDAARLTFTKASDAELERLAGAGVAWLRGRPVLRARVTGRALGVVAAAPDYVAGVIVGRDETLRPPRWVALDVAWIAAAGNATTLFVFAPGDRPPAAALPELSGARHLPGTRHRARLVIDPVFAAGEGTRELSLTVTAADGQRAASDPRGDPERYGNESAAAPTVRLVAVDRRRPPAPPAPHVEIAHADVHGRSPARVTWEPRAGVRHHVTRAVDSAVFTRDLEQRRRATGHYERLDADAIMADDPDFERWIVARFPALRRSWRTRLLGVAPDTPRWVSATPVWRAWLERFAPALTAEEVRALASRRGTEPAFTRVTAHPVDGGAYLDSVPGRVRNAYLYRLEAVSAALQPGTEPGPVSAPVRPPPTRPPAAPAIVRVVPADRRIMLSWAHNREPDLGGYRVYRSATAEAPAELIAGERDLPDSRITARGGALRLPIDVTEIAAVYRAAEYDPRRPPGAQRQALDLHGDATVFDGEREVRGLRRVADGEPLVVVYRAPDGALRSTADEQALPAWADTDVNAAATYWYRLTAVGSGGLESAPSEAVSARALELGPPALPPFTFERRDAAGSRVRNVIRCSAAPPGLQARVRRRSPEDPVWRTMAPWGPLAAPFEHADEVDAAAVRHYRIDVRSDGKRVAEHMAEFASGPG